MDRDTIIKIIMNEPLEHTALGTPSVLKQAQKIADKVLALRRTQSEGAVRTEGVDAALRERAQRISAQIFGVCLDADEAGTDFPHRQLFEDAGRFIAEFTGPNSDPSEALLAALSTASLPPHAQSGMVEKLNPKPIGWMVRWNRQPRYDEVKYFEREAEAANYKRELDDNGWTDPELIALYDLESIRALATPSIPAPDRVVAFDPMAGCPQCEWLSDGVGHHLHKKCELHQKIEDMQVDQGLYRQVHQDTARMLNRVCEIIGADEDDDPARIAQARMDEIKAFEDVAPVAESELREMLPFDFEPSDGETGPATLSDKNGDIICTMNVEGVSEEWQLKDEETLRRREGALKWLAAMSRLATFPSMQTEKGNG